MKIIIEGVIEDVDKVFDGGYLPMLDMGRYEYYVAENDDAAGKANRRYWQDMADKDPKEFTAIIGEARLIEWALGQGGSLEDFLDEVEGAPEENFGSYDGSSSECSVDLDDADEYKGKLEWDDHGELSDPEQRAIQDELDELADELGFDPTVAFRHN